jgi:Zn-finger nucleic acid-binding protein
MLRWYANHGDGICCKVSSWREIRLIMYRIRDGRGGLLDCPRCAGVWKFLEEIMARKCRTNNYSKIAQI